MPGFFPIVLGSQIFCFISENNKSFETCPRTLSKGVSKTIEKSGIIFKKTVGKESVS